MSPRSDEIIIRLKTELHRISSMNVSSEQEKVRFLREFLIILNKFFFERRDASCVEELQSVFYTRGRVLPQWKRHTEFLAIWDDYSETILSFVCPEERITALAERLNIIFQFADSKRVSPVSREPNVNLFPRITGSDYIFLRLIHALQDFSQLLPEINQELADKLINKFARIPTAVDLRSEEGAREFLNVLGGADSNVDERVRYITSACEAIANDFNGDAYCIFEKCNGDAEQIFNALTAFVGIASKKANMLLRDFYELGLWLYTINLESINIIADNRIMRIALRTGIINFELPKLLNSLLDQYDYQYVLTVRFTEEAFRRVWIKCRDLNNGVPIVSYPARFDSFFFNLGSPRGPKGCCGPNDISCVSQKPRKDFYNWLVKEIPYKCNLPCPLDGVCPDDLKKQNPPFAIQNNTWNSIFTNEGGGGGLRGI